MDSLTVSCQSCKALFTIEPDDFGFYEKVGVPAPKDCPVCRQLWDGNCAKCGAGFRTSYSPEQQKEYKIYCETCYQHEVG